MQTFLIPLDLVFVPNDYSGKKYDMPFCNNEYIPLSASLPSNVSIPSWKNFQLFNSNIPRVDAYDRDRLIVKEDLGLVLSAKAAGKSWIHAKADDDVIRRWESRDPSALKEIVQRTGRTRFYKPVYHEAFRKAKVSRPLPVRLDRFRRLMGPMGAGLTGLDIGCNMAFMTHHMVRQGFDMTAIDFDKQHLEVAECLTKTYGLSAKIIETQFDSFNPETSYDVVFALTVLYHIFFRQDNIDPKDAARKAGSLSKSVLFWESGDQPEKEKELLLNFGGFDCYRTLGPTQGTGLDRELGFFCKSSTDLSGWLLKRYEELDLQWIVGNPIDHYDANKLNEPGL